MNQENNTEVKILEIEGKQVKVILRKPASIVNGVTLYGQVLSFTKDGRFYGVKKRRTGRGRYSFSCQCDGYFFGGKTCVHIHAFRLVERSEDYNG